MRRIFVIIAWGFVLFIQFAWSSSCNLFKLKPAPKYFKPSASIVELPEVKIITEVLSKEHFEKTNGRTFDAKGVYLTNSKYHPVNLFQYGIFCYAMYLRTGKDEFKKSCIAQFNYFLDSTKYNRWDDCGIGFPYEIVFADLKPQWYSGLAQSEGIMYLIRYYNLTHDKRALDYIQDVKRFMLTPVEAGGTLKKISDKEIWIEEYANSKTKAEVINGFVTAIMGLREYTLLFPDDIEAKKVLEKCLYTHKKWLNKFDNGSGILYDQGSKGVVGDYYSKFQVIQMKQMFELFADTFYKNIEMLWASYAYGKGAPGVTGCIISDTNFSSPAVLKDGWFRPLVNYRSVLDTNLVDTVLTSDNGKKGLRQIFDNNRNTNYSFHAGDSTGEVPYIQVNLKKSVRAAGWWLQVVPELKSSAGFKIYVRSGEDNAWKKIKTENTGKMDNRYYFLFDETDIRQMKIEFYGTPKNLTLSISEINLIAPKSMHFTHYSHFISKEFEIIDTLCNFSFIKNDVDNVVVFYKTADVKDKLQVAKWNVDNAIRASTFRVPRGKYCRFLVIFRNDSPDSAISQIAY